MCDFIGKSIRNKDIGLSFTKNLEFVERGCSARPRGKAMELHAATFFDRRVYKLIYADRSGVSDGLNL